MQHLLNRGAAARGAGNLPRAFGDGRRADRDLYRISFTSRHGFRPSRSGTCHASVRKRKRGGADPRAETRGGPGPTKHWICGRRQQMSLYLFAALDSWARTKLGVARRAEAWHAALYAVPVGTGRWRAAPSAPSAPEGSAILGPELSLVNWNDQIQPRPRRSVRPLVLRIRSSSIRQ